MRVQNSAENISQSKFYEAFSVDIYITLSVSCKYKPVVCTWDIADFTLC